MDIVMFGIGWLMGFSILLGALGGWLLFFGLLLSSLKLPESWWQAGRRWRGPIGLRTPTAG